jgi:hypothetical protein
MAVHREDRANRCILGGWRRLPYTGRMELIAVVSNGTIEVTAEYREDGAEGCMQGGWS